MSAGPPTRKLVCNAMGSSNLGGMLRLIFRTFSRSLRTASMVDVFIGNFYARERFD